MEEIKLAVVVQQQGKRRHFVVDKDLVSIGKSEDCEIVVSDDDPDIPQKHILFSYNNVGNSYELRIKPDIFRGWIKIGEDEVSVKDVALRAKVRKENDQIILPLETTGRGRIQLGDTVIGYGFQSFAGSSQKKPQKTLAAASVGWVEVIQGGSLKKYLVKKNQVFLAGNTVRSAVKEPTIEKELKLFYSSGGGYSLTVIPGFYGVVNKDGERLRIDDDFFAKINSVEKTIEISAGDRADLKFKNSFIVRLGVREEEVRREAVKESLTIPPAPEDRPPPIEKERGKPKWERFNNRPHDRLTVGEHSKDRKIFTIFDFTTAFFWIFWILYAFTVKVEALNLNLATAEETLKRLEESDLLDVSLTEDIESLRRGTLGVTTTGEGTSEGTGSGSGTGTGSGSGSGSGAGGSVGQGGQTSRVARGLRVLGVGSGPSTGPVGLGGGDASIQDLLAGGASLSGVSGGMASAAGGSGGLGGGVTGTVGVTGGNDISTGPATGGDLQHQRTAGVRGGTIADLSGSAATSGARDAADVRRAIVRYQGRLKYFYERELEVNPALQGKIVVRITISEEGYVSNVSMASSTLGSPSLEQQILSAISGWTFGAIDPGGGSFTFTVPFNFYSQ